MRNQANLSSAYDQPQRLALIVGVVALVAGVAGGFLLGDPARFYQSYLFSFAFWVGLSAGCLALLLLYFLVGSRWGLTIRRVVEAGSSTIWLMAVLFIPILIGMRVLFLWANPDVVAGSEALQFKSFYLNVPFFIVRAVIYFAAWIWLATRLNRWSTRLSETGDVGLRDRLKGWGAFGLIVYTLTMTFAAIDWLMSLQPFWNSTIYGLVIILGQVLTGLAFGIVMLNLLPDLSMGKKWDYKTTPIPYKDLGALLLAFVMGWAYLAYFQLLIIWAGNIPRDVTWYLDRTQGGWLIVGLLIVVFQLVIPFMALLSIRIRHNLRVLGLLGVGLVGIYLINMYWQVIPAFHPGQFSLSWLDIVLPIGIGGLWLAAFFYFLKRRPPLSAPEKTSILTAEGREAAIP